jgi:hypothetical protein
MALFDERGYFFMCNWYNLIALVSVLTHQQKLVMQPSYFSCAQIPRKIVA